MKKFLSLILIFSLLFTITSCTQDKLNSALDSSTTALQNPSLSEVNNAKEDTTSSEVGGGTPTLTKYRSIYCDIPRPFINLVDLYEFQDWYEIIIENDPNETEIMPMKLFIQEFNISRENFDKANLEWAKIIVEGFKGHPILNPQDFANQEINEVYNAEIIYTFSDKIINDYYLSHEYPYLYELEYEQAVADGTYQTRTSDWVDVEAMEAEIIAKYGEAEIIPEEPTDIPEVTDALPQESESTQVTEAVTT